MFLHITRGKSTFRDSIRGTFYVCKTDKPNS